MVLPGFTAGIYLNGRKNEYGLVHDQTNASPSISPSQLCEYYYPGCHRMCIRAGKRGEEYYQCMCDCWPSCFCEFP